uniref:Translation initiation factor 5A C-terminal domain-containing protein n=1 Tax=Zea mays TaxID=4577 RepID=A0A804QZV5_MAIZE
MSPAVIPLPPHHLRPPLRSPSVEGSLPPLPSPPQSMDAPAPRRAHTCLVLLLVPTLLLLPSMARRLWRFLPPRLDLQRRSMVPTIPHVNRTEYQLIDISEDGFVSLLTSDGNTKDDLRLPTDETLVAQAYLLAMLALVIVLFYFTIFAFIVTHRGTRNWDRIRSCLQDSKADISEQIYLSSWVIPE